MVHYRSGDENDLDIYGLDAQARRRLGVRKFVPPKKIITKKTKDDFLPAHAPVSWGVRESIDLLKEAKSFITIGRNSDEDSVGYVISKFYNSVPDFDNSVVSHQRVKNGHIIQGSWPSSGQQIFDWQLEAWGEGAGGVVVKFIMMSAKGRTDGHSFRTNRASVGRLIPKFIKRYYGVMKDEMKKEAGAKIGRLR